jgi:hypothetical protein
VPAFQQTLKSLGTLREIALFAHEELGGDQVYRYRARYEKGLLEVNLGYASNGKIAAFNLIPVEDWTAPLQPADDDWNAPPLEE